MDTSPNHAIIESNTTTIIESTTTVDSSRRLEAMSLSDSDVDSSDNNNNDNTPETNKTPLRITGTTTTHLSDSDDDDLDASFSGFDNLNLPARLKRLMRDTTLTKDNMEDDNDEDDSDNEDDPIKDNALFRTPAAVKTAAIQEMLKKTPPTPSEPTVAKPRRKDPIDFLAQHSDYSSSEEENTVHRSPTRRRRQPQTKKRVPKAPRRSKKKTTGLDEEEDPLDGKDKADDSDEESESDSDAEATPTKRNRPPKRKMSKKAELLMHQENQRIARSVAARLQPRTNKLKIGGAVEKIKGRKKMGLNNDDDEESNTTSLRTSNDPTPQHQLNRQQQAMMAFLEDDDSDIEIIGGPSKRGFELASPDQARHPTQFWKSPKRKTTITHRDLNRRLQGMMMEDIAKLRKEYEEKARAQGNYLTPEERAKKQMEREKEAKAIDLQVKQHFLKGTPQGQTSKTTESKTLDEDEDEDALLEYSGDEEEYEEEEEEDEEDDDDRASIRDPLNEAVADGVPEVDEDITMHDQEDDASMGLADKEAASPGIEDRKRKRNNAILLDDDEDLSDNNDEDRVKKLKEGLSLSDFLKGAKKDTPVKEPELSKKDKSQYLDAEADESEDEYYGAGGADMSDDEHLDQFEKDDMLVDKTDEKVDEAALRSALNNQLAESDKHMVERLLKDIMSGDLRRRRAAKEMGLMLDDFDIYDDNDNDLVALRLAAAERRRKLLEENGDGLELLAKDPKTRAFAQAGQPLPEASDPLDLSDVEEDGEGDRTPAGKVSMIVESDEDDEIEIPVEDDDDKDESLDDIQIFSETAHTVSEILASPMEERIDVVQRRVREDPTASPTARAQRRNRLRHLLNDVNSSLGSSGDNSGPRAGLTSAQQAKERKVSKATAKNVQFNDMSPVQKRQPRLLSLLKNK
ncbi:MRC1-like domain-containing protein [Phascolomyces articulosus]|uniref:MRC1-like domain-containing protein n=1 Tax=Phascolomyces articulosus TaxID=60185 RepID=A0AAD5K7Y9_9FUNG|nr:MRC1-like domain-containing protein [Phascolomyces articulosus]